MDQATLDLQDYEKADSDNHPRQYIYIAAYKRIDKGVFPGGGIGEVLRC